MLTAHEAKQSIAYISPLHAHVYEIEHIDIVSRYEFRVTLKHACPLFLNFLASPRFVMLNSALQFDVGCGPFRLQTNSAEKIEFVAFDHYFKERPWIDRVELLITDDADLSPIHYMPLQQEPYEVIEQIEQGASYIFLNSTRVPFSNVTNRAYIWHYITNEAFIFTPTREFAAHGWLTSRRPLQLDSNTSTRPMFNVPLQIGYQQIRAGANHFDYAKKLQQLLRTTSIDSELRCMDYQQYDTLPFEEIDIFIGGNALLQDINLSFYLLYTTSARQLFNMMNELDKYAALAILHKAKQTPHPASLFYELECSLQTSYHMKFLTHRKHMFYVHAHSNFSGITFDTHGRINYRALYMKS